MAKPDISTLTVAEATEIVRGIVRSPEVLDMPYKSDADAENIFRRVRRLLADVGFNSEGAAITVDGNTFHGKVRKVSVRIMAPCGEIYTH